MSEARLVAAPIDSRETFTDKAYTALRNVIVSSDIYRSRQGQSLFVFGPVIRGEDSASLNSIE